MVNAKYMTDERRSQFKIGILSTYPPQKCGIATYTRYLVDELKGIVNIEVIQIDKPDSCDPFYFLKLARKAKKYEIVHIQHEYGLFGFNSFLIPYLYIIPMVFLYLRFPRKCKIVVTLHTVNLRSLLIFFLPNLFMMKFSDRIIVHTETARKLLIKQGINESKILVLPHGVYQNPMRLDKDYCKEILGLKGKKILLTFGFICRWKNYKVIIDILPYLGEDIVLLIAGGPRKQSDISYYRNLINYVNYLNRQDQVVFYGYVKEKDIPLIFNSAEIAILTNRNTTQSGVLNLLLSFKLPVIAPSLDYFQEIKDDYGCIEVYRLHDRDDLKKKISKLLSNDEKRAQLANNSEYYWKERNWQRIAKDLKETYVRLMQE